MRLVKKSDESMVEVLALLNSGYRKGQCAIRVEKVEQGSLQIAMFDTFGFKVQQEPKNWLPLCRAAA